MCFRWTNDTQIKMICRLLCDICVLSGVWAFVQAKVKDNVCQYVTIQFSILKIHTWVQTGKVTGGNKYKLYYVKEANPQ